MELNKIDIRRDVSGERGEAEGAMEEIEEGEEERRENG